MNNSSVDQSNARDAKSNVEGSAIPDDILRVVLELGDAEWGVTPSLDAEGHAAMLRETIALTERHFGLEGPQQMHGLYLAGTGVVLCHSGMSPNSPTIARALTGAWNRLVEDARAQAKATGEPSPADTAGSAAGSVSHREEPK